jgi:hypothetical protein
MMATEPFCLVLVLRQGTALAVPKKSPKAGGFSR